MKQSGSTPKHRVTQQINITRGTGLEDIRRNVNSKQTNSSSVRIEEVEIPKQTGAFPARRHKTQAAAPARRALPVAANPGTSYGSDSTSRVYVTGHVGLFRGLHLDRPPEELPVNQRLGTGTRDTTANNNEYGRTVDDPNLPNRRNQGPADTRTYYNLLSSVNNYTKPNRESRVRFPRVYTSFLVNQLNSNDTTRSCARASSHRVRRTQSDGREKGGNLNTRKRRSLSRSPVWEEVEEDIDQEINMNCTSDENTRDEALQIDRRAECPSVNSFAVEKRGDSPNTVIRKRHLRLLSRLVMTEQSMVDMDMYENTAPNIDNASTPIHQEHINFSKQTSTVVANDSIKPTPREYGSKIITQPLHQRDNEAAHTPHICSISVKKLATDNVPAMSAISAVRLSNQPNEMLITDSDTSLVCENKESIDIDKENPTPLATVCQLQNKEGNANSLSHSQDDLDSDDHNEDDFDSHKDDSKDIVDDSNQNETNIKRNNGNDNAAKSCRHHEIHLDGHQSNREILHNHLRNDVSLNINFENKKSFGSVNKNANGDYDYNRQEENLNTYRGMQRLISDGSDDHTKATFSQQRNKDILHVNRSALHSQCYNNNVQKIKPHSATKDENYKCPHGEGDIQLTGPVDTKGLLDELMRESRDLKHTAVSYHRNIQRGAKQERETKKFGAKDKLSEMENQSRSSKRLFDDAVTLGKIGSRLGSDNVTQRENNDHCNEETRDEKTNALSSSMDVLARHQRLVSRLTAVYGNIPASLDMATYD